MNSSYCGDSGWHQCSPWTWARGPRSGPPPALLFPPPGVKNLGGQGHTPTQNQCPLLEHSRDTQDFKISCTIVPKLGSEPVFPASLLQTGLSGQAVDIAGGCEQGLDVQPGASTQGSTSPLGVQDGARKEKEKGRC